MDYVYVRMKGSLDYDWMLYPGGITLDYVLGSLPLAVVTYFH